jgi:hypothetical protein
LTAAGTSFATAGSAFAEDGVVLGVELEPLEPVELLLLLPHAASPNIPSATAGTDSRLLHDFIHHSFPKRTAPA